MLGPDLACCLGLFTCCDCDSHFVQVLFRLGMARCVRGNLPGLLGHDRDLAHALLKNRGCHDPRN